MYLYGLDSYRRTRALREKILEPYLVKYPDASVARFDFEEADMLTQFQDFVSSGSLFAKVKLVIAYNVEEVTKEIMPILKNLVEDKSTTAVIVSEKKLAKAFDFLLQDPVKTYEFELLEGATFAGFLKQEVSEQGLAVSDEVIKHVAQTYQGNTWGAVTELQKIRYGSNLETVSATPEFFPLMQSLKSMAPASRLKALFYVLETIEPAAAFNVLATLVSGGDKIKMADYDVAIKSGKLEYEEALTDFVLS